MIRWMGESAGFGGEPSEERPGTVASFGGDAFVEVELLVGEEPGRRTSDEDDGWER